MQMRKSATQQGQRSGPRPRREVRDLIADMGRVEHRGDTRVVRIDPNRLPGYLRDMPVAREALQWVLFVSCGGSATRWLKLKPRNISHSQRQIA